MPGFITGTASDSPKMRIAKTITNGFETVGLNAVSTIIRKELTIIAIQHQKVIKALRIPFIFLIPASIVRIFKWRKKSPAKTSKDVSLSRYELIIAGKLKECVVNVFKKLLINKKNKIIMSEQSILWARILGLLTIDAAPLVCSFYFYHLLQQVFYVLIR